jgi:hypothetical protein
MFLPCAVFTLWNANFGGPPLEDSTGAPPALHLASIIPNSKFDNAILLRIKYGNVTAVPTFSGELASALSL